MYRFKKIIFLFFICILIILNGCEISSQYSSSNSSASSYSTKITITNNLPVTETTVYTSAYLGKSEELIPIKEKDYFDIQNAAGLAVISNVTINTDLKLKLKLKNSMRLLGETIDVSYFDTNQKVTKLFKIDDNGNISEVLNISYVVGTNIEYDISNIIKTNLVLQSNQYIDIIISENSRSTNYITNYQVTSCYYYATETPIIISAKTNFQTNVVTNQMINISAVYNAGDYVIVLFGNQYHTDSGYLCRKSDGAVFSLEKAGYPLQNLWSYWGNSFDDGAKIYADIDQNLYYLTYYQSSSYGLLVKLIKIDASNPEELIAKDLSFTVGDENVLSFMVDKYGNIIYNAYIGGANYSVYKYVLSSSGNVKKLSSSPEGSNIYCYWLGPDKEFYGYVRLNEQVSLTNYYLERYHYYDNNLDGIIDTYTNFYIGDLNSKPQEYSNIAYITNGTTNYYINYELYYYSFGILLTNISTNFYSGNIENKPDRYSNMVITTNYRYDGFYVLSTNKYWYWGTNLYEGFYYQSYYLGYRQLGIYNLYLWEITNIEYDPFTGETNITVIRTNCLSPETPPVSNYDTIILTNHKEYYTYSQMAADVGAGNIQAGTNAAIVPTITIITQQNFYSINEIYDLTNQSFFIINYISNYGKVQDIYINTNIYSIITQWYDTINTNLSACMGINEENYYSSYPYLNYTPRAFYFTNYGVSDLSIQNDPSSWWSFTNTIGYSNWNNWISNDIGDAYFWAYCTGYKTNSSGYYYYINNIESNWYSTIQPYKGYITSYYYDPESYSSYQFALTYIDNYTKSFTNDSRWVAGYYILGPYETNYYLSTAEGSKIKKLNINADGTIITSDYLNKIFTWSDGFRKKIEINGSLFMLGNLKLYEVYNEQGIYREFNFSSNFTSINDAFTANNYIILVGYNNNNTTVYKFDPSTGLSYNLLANIPNYEILSINPSPNGIFINFRNGNTKIVGKVDLDGNYTEESSISGGQIVILERIK